MGWGRAADAASAALIAISATLRCPVAAVPQSNPRTERRAQRPSLSNSLVRKDAVDLALRHRLPLLSTS